jgi:hypothetical protein
MHLSSSALRHGMLVALLLVLTLSAPCESLGSEGSLGIYSDPEASRCDLAVPSGATRTFYVVFVPAASTRGGIHGMEFQIDTSQATGYLIASEAPMDPSTVVLGRAFSGGLQIAWTECQSGLAIPVLSFQVLNLGSGASDAPLQVRAHGTPSNTMFDCAHANLCDFPTFTKVCVSNGVGILNATGDVACGSGAQKKKWTGVKALYK